MSSILPLAGVKVADFGIGMATALVCKFLAEAGAEVRRMEPCDGDPSEKIYPAYKVWQSTLSDRNNYSEEYALLLAATSDICIVGGEAFFENARRPDVAAWRAANPRLIILEMAASLSDETFNILHCADVLIQARSGLVFEAYPDRPALLGFNASAIGTALNALVAVSAALCSRETTGVGQVVQVGLLEGAMTWPLAFWGSAEKVTPRYAFRAPRGVRALIFQTCDDTYVQIVLGSAGAKYKLYKLLGIEDPDIQPHDAGMPNAADGPDKYFGDVDLLAPYVGKWQGAALLDALTKVGVVCEAVLSPGANWRGPQVRCNEIMAATLDACEYVGQPVKWQFSDQGPIPARALYKASDSPLKGIRVVDFGAFVAGPVVSTGLADLGAEVIKIEPPTGDPLRNIYRFYVAANRGKRSISIEMKSAQGRDLAHRLVQKADVVCSNFRHGVAERLGIDAASIVDKQPDKIVVFNAGYGVIGPKTSAPAFDPCIQAACGLEVRAGGKGNLPILNPMMMSDLCGGMLGQIGTLMALYRRAREGRGASVTVPLLNAGLFLLSDIYRMADEIMQGPIELLPDQTGYHPAEKLYQTSDGWIAVAARDEFSARALCAAFHVSVSKPRSEWSAPEVELLTVAIGRHSTVSALDILLSAKVPAERCREHAGEDFLADDRNVASGFVYEAHSAELGTYRGIGRLFCMESTTDGPRGEVSELGQDTRAILAELGLGETEIGELITDQSVRENQAVR
ncbi:MAG: CoA transferase [Sphingomonadales bacterium]|nr:CoA transferase [Sphingomonadales bacterium]